MVKTYGNWQIKWTVFSLIFVFLHVESVFVDILTIQAKDKQGCCQTKLVVRSIQVPCVDVYNGVVYLRTLTVNRISWRGDWMTDYK